MPKEMAIANTQKSKYKNLFFTMSLTILNGSCYFKNDYKSSFTTF